MVRFLFSLVFVASVVGSPVVWAARPDSALAALDNLPPRYRNGVVFLSADNADPNPDEWYITARNSARAGMLMNLTISRGRIVSERPAISPRAFLRQIMPINLASIRVNSTDLWRKADSMAAERGRRLGTLSLQLQQHGRYATPVWSVWLYDSRGRYLGFFSALATTGAITDRSR